MRRALWTCAVVVAVVFLGSRVYAQAVPRAGGIATSAGTFILDLMPEAAPNTVAFFTKTAESGGYDGTVFHRAVRNGMVQGGDPLSKDPLKKAQYGTGGLNQ